MPSILRAGFLVLALAGCAVFGSEAVQRAKDEGVPESHMVSLGEAVVGTRVTGNDLAVVLVFRDADGEFQSSAIGSTQLVVGANTFYFVSGSGVGLGWNTFLYGSAAPGVTRVSSTLPDARGGEVIDGVWVIASPSEGLSMGDVEVAFLDEQGDVIEQQ